jgi:hypothetical protein
MDVCCQVYKLKPEAHTQAAAPPKGAERIKTTWGYPRGHAAASVYHEPPYRHGGVPHRRIAAITQSRCAEQSLAGVAGMRRMCRAPGLWQVPALARA